MKVIITKKEMESYLSVLEVTVRPMMSEIQFTLMKESVKEQIKSGIKEGAIKIGLNKKLNLVYSIEPEFICKILDLYSKYLTVVIPQVMSIYSLTKNLMEDTYKVSLDFNNKSDK